MIYFYMRSFLLSYMELCNTRCYGVCKCAVEITFMERYLVDPNCELTASAAELYTVFSSDNFTACLYALRDQRLQRTQLQEKGLVGNWHYMLSAGTLVVCLLYKM